jgi:STE24 endopeptidase
MGRDSVRRVLAVCQSDDCVVVLLCSCSICRLRQFPLYSKKEPPAALKDHFSQETFDKSQAYGRDKAKFALFSGLYKQIMDSALIHYGTYAWSWNLAGKFLAKFGYGGEYEVGLL